MGGGVGREAELGALVAAARRALGGRGSVAIVEGEAGIGKTHLLERFEREAGDLGLAVRRAAAQELERRRPFGSVFDALASHPGIDDVDRTATEFQIEEALLTLLDRTAANSPVAVVIDDLQWADPATLALASRLARLVPQLRLLVVVGVRSAPRPPEVSQLLVALRAAGALEVPVGALTHDEVDAMVLDAVGAPPGPSLSELLAGASGSPLFVGQLLAGLLAAEALHIDDDGRMAADDVGVPTSLSAAVLRRLDQLDPDTVEVLQLAAVLGTSFAVTDLGVVSGRRAVDLYGPLQSALAAGIVREEDLRLAFVHDLVRLALYEHLPRAMRASLHRDVAVALAAAGAPPLQVGEHFVRGAAPGDREAVAWLERAAADAGGRSPAAASELLEHAEGLLPEADSQRARLARLRARYLSWSGRALDAELLCRRELLAARSRADEGAVRRVLLATLFAQSRIREALDEAEWILADPSTDLAEQVRTGAASAWGSVALGDLDAAERAAERTLELARAVDDSPSTHASHMTLGVVARMRGRAATGLGHLDRADEVARRSAKPVGEQNPADMWRGMLLFDLDRTHEALVALRRGRARAEAAGIGMQVAMYHAAIGWVLMATGEVDDAAAECRSGLDLSIDFGTGWRLGSYGVLVSAAVRRDDLDGAVELSVAAEDHLQRAGGRQPLLDLFRQAEAELLEAQGRPDEARRNLAEVWQACVRRSEYGSVPFLAPDLARVMVFTGHTDSAEELVASVELAADLLDSPTARSAALTCRGLLTEDLDALVAAADVARTGPRPFGAARADEDAGRALAHAGHNAAAQERLLAAVATYETLGAMRNVARIEVALRAAGVRRGQRGFRQRPRVGWDSLTTTERRVADHVAAGLSNPDIAERMFLSRRTVQTHVSHVLAKTGFTSRVELAAAVARRAG